MTKNRPRCPVCGHPTKKNGTTSKGTTRWRCKDCGHSFVRTTQHDHPHAATMRLFTSWATGLQSLTYIADTHHTSRRTLTRQFHWCWWITPPEVVDPHRIHDQIFLDATFLASGCLLIASNRTHIINWSWARTENTAAYRELITPIPAPLMVVIDGGQGAASAVASAWPTTIIQRCLVHAQRVVRRHTTTRPRTDAGKAIYALALHLTRIHTLDQAAEWTVHLQQFGAVHHDWLNEKTTVQDPVTHRSTQVFTHPRVRAAYHSLLSLYRRKLLFNYLQPPADAADPTAFASSTNVLEAGFNAPVKELARRHRGLSRPHQRTVIDWWLYLKTQTPDDPVAIARSQDWGQVALSTAQDLIRHENTHPDRHGTGAPAGYDIGIDSGYQHSMGIQKGWVSS